MLPLWQLLGYCAHYRNLAAAEPERDAHAHQGRDLLSHSAPAGNPDQLSCSQSVFAHAGIESALTLERVPRDANDPVRQ